MKRGWLLFLVFSLLLMSGKPLMGQFFSIGVDPSSVKWKKIETTHYKVIFPEEYASKAQEVVRSLEIMHPKIGESLKMSPRKTTLIIHNRTIISNGLTTLTPKRVELFTAQSPDSYTQPWMDQLILHEMRHICQMDKLNNSTTRLLYYLFGDQVVGGVLGLYIPSWFMEGDAVLTETTLSNSGRGRTPVFTSELRSTLVSRGVDSYNKSLFGSYKEPVADQYQQGFYLVKTATQKWGSDFWANNLSKTAKYPFLLNPFRRSFKKQAGINLTKFYKQTMSELAVAEKQRIAQTEINENSAFTDDINRYVNYKTIAVVNDSMVIATKEQLHQTNQIVLLKNGKQQVIEENSLIVTGSLSANKNIVCWTERRYHPRWEQSSWFALITYDLVRKKRNVIIPKCRLHQPNISHSATQIVAVEQNTTDSNTLNIFNIQGKLLQKIAAPSPCIIMQPKWSENDSIIVAVLLTRKGKQLARYTISEQKWETISTPTFKDFQLWQIIGDSALMTVSDVNNTPICKTSLTDGGCSVVATLPFDIVSAYQTSTQKIICLQTTANGKKPYLVVPSSDSKSINLFGEQLPDEYSSIIKSDKPVDFESAADTTYLVKPYRKISHLINIHSWGPVSVNGSSGTLDPGLSISSQNDLSTSVLEAGARYSMAEKNTTYYSNYTYSGWFAEVTANVERQKMSNPTTHNSWDQSEYKIGLKVPLLFQRRNYVIPLTINAIASNIGYSNVEKYLGNNQALHLQLFQGVVKRSARQALLPPLGYTVEFNLKKSISGSINAGWIGSFENTVYLPSFFKNHGISIYGGYQHIAPSQFSYGMMLQYPRGFVGTVRSNALAASINYKFPLCYPDWSVGSMLYLKRIRTHLFYDYMQFEKPQSYLQFESMGLEILADSYWFRFVAPINIGGRFTYVPTKKSIVSELIFGISFDAL